MSEVDAQTTIFRLGSLHVYGVQGQGYYWQDAGSPQGYGPFVSVWAACQHYEWLIKLCKTGAEGVPQLGKVVRVDFKNKQRVDQ